MFSKILRTKERSESFKMRIKRSENGPLSLVTLISGNGTNLQTIINAIHQDNLPASISAVISNCADAYGLERAKNAGIPTQILNHQQFTDRTTFDHALQQLIDQFDPDLIVLAGFMRILSAEFVDYFYGRMLNIHPSLLPKYRGLNTHQRAIDAGDKVHGTSIHFVTPDLDSGPIIIQSKVPIQPQDTAKTLTARVQQQEYLIYPLVIRLIAQQRLCLENDAVLFDGHRLDSPLIYDPNITL